MKLTREEVLHIAALSRLGMTEEDIARYGAQLSNILENFEVLNKVDTANVPPTAQPNALCNVLKDDIVQPSMPVADVMANAPKQEDNFFKIRAVLE